MTIKKNTNKIIAFSKVYSIKKKLNMDSKKLPNVDEENSLVVFDVVFTKTGKSIKIPKLSETDATAANKNIAYILAPMKS